MKVAAKILLLGLFAGDLWAHSIEAMIITGGVGVVARYADGSPAAFAEARVFAPGEDRPFQEGLTDRNGFFLFMPTHSGTWRVEIDDGMGHVIEQRVSAQNHATSSQNATERPTRTWALLTGVSLIWGLFGTWGWWRARKR